MTNHQFAAHSRRGSGGGEPVRVRLLGGFRVSVGSRDVRDFEWRRKAGSLVKILSLSRGRRMHREGISNLLWPSLDAKHAGNNLHRTLHSARKSLAPTPITLRDGMVSLCPDGQIQTDVEAFEEASRMARRTRDPSAYRAAIEIYAGELLPEDRFEEWAEEKRNELRALHISLLVELAGIHEDRGEHSPGIEALRAAISEEGAHEEAHASLMRLLALRGNRAEAVLHYEKLDADFARKLGMKPGPAVRRLYEDIRAGRPMEDRRVETPPASPSGNLPVPLTSFVGREREMVEVKRTLSMTRLLTLTGAGGCGKTRLAVEVARGLAGLCPDGVWLVELAPLSGGVAKAVAAALGVHERPDLPLADTLAEYLRGRNLLLVLDNCEHLVDGAARLSEALLGACENLRILATSREPLGVPGEAVWTLPPLSLPDEDEDFTVGGLMRCEAVRLFVDRARSRLSGFELNTENAAAVARACERLDGIPLAIELATARMGAFAVEKVAERLGGSLALLASGQRTTTPRHRTMRATLEWSHDLLDEAERTLFRRLSIFAGGFSLEAAEGVCSEEGIAKDDILDLLSRLVDKSLVASPDSEGGGAPRHRMLEPVRQYASERLEESGEGERVRERHASYYLALAEEAEPELVGAEQRAWLARLTTEYANVRAALGWFLDEGAASEERARMGLRLASALGRFWSISGPNEGREWLEKGLAKSGAAPESVRAKALCEAGLMAVYHLDLRATTMLEESLSLYKALEDELGQATSLNYLMHAIGILGYHERMPTLREETEALIAASPKNRRTAAHLQLTLGMMAMIEQDHAQVTCIEEALVLFREAGDVRSHAQCLTIMGIDALGRGEVGRAAPAFEETLRLLRRLKDKIGTFYSLMGAAGVAVLRDRPTRAARLAGAAESLRKAIGHPAQPLKRVNYDYEGYTGAMREVLGDASFEAAFSEGHAMFAEEAIDYALSADEPPAPSAPTKKSPPALTAREEEIAALAALGLTNRRIAEELSISKRTVDTHVSHILEKLGLKSRAEIPAHIERRDEAG